MKSFGKKRKNNQKHQIYIVFNVNGKCLFRLKTVGHIAIIVGGVINMEKYSITEICPHDIAETRVLATACGCETTAEYCISCNEQLSEPKTEC